RVDEGEDGPAEASGELHHAHRLPVALGVGHAEVPLHLLARGAALLVADHRDRAAIEPREAPDDGGVFGKRAVAVQLEEVVEDRVEVVEKVRAVRVPAQLHLLPDVEVLEDVRLEPYGARLELEHLRVDSAVPRTRGRLQLGDALLELDERLFEVQMR